MHHLQRWGAGGGGRARSPASPDSAAAAAAAVEGRAPSAFGGACGVAAAQRREASAGAPGAQIHRHPWGLRSLAPRPPTHPVRPGGDPPPHLFPSRPPPPPPPRPARARGRLAFAPGLRPQTPAGRPRTRGPSPRTPPGPGSPRPAASSAPAIRAPPSPSPHPLGPPSHSGPGTLAPPPAQSLTGPAGPGPAERGRRLHRQRQAAASAATAPAVGPTRGRSPATPRVRSAARRPAGSRPAPRVPKAGAVRRLSDSLQHPGASELSVYPESIYTRGAIRWAPESPPPPKDHRLRLCIVGPSLAVVGPEEEGLLLPALVELQVQEKVPAFSLPNSLFCVSLS